MFLPEILVPESVENVPRNSKDFEKMIPAAGYSSTGAKNDKTKKPKRC
jgi:hypothetical protein